MFDGLAALAEEALKFRVTRAYCLQWGLGVKQGGLGLNTEEFRGNMPNCFASSPKYRAAMSSHVKASLIGYASSAVLFGLGLGFLNTELHRIPLERHDASGDVREILAFPLKGRLWESSL